MFRVCNNLTSLNVSSFDTSKVANMGHMFRYCGKLESLDLSNFDTSKVTTMASMFRDCRGLTNLDLSDFNTSSAKGMQQMFYYCSRLTTLDISGFDTRNVTDMALMFYNDIVLQRIYVGDNWNTEQVENTVDTSLSISVENQLMLYGCVKLVGGSETSYSSSNENDLTYAHVDEGETNPGYLTYKEKTPEEEIDPASVNSLMSNNNKSLLNANYGSTLGELLGITNE